MPVVRTRRAASVLPALMAGLLVLALAACDEASPPPGAASAPEQSVLVLAGRLRDNDLVGFAHDAIPPGLHPAMAEAWRSGRTRWPLDELPFDHRIPGMLATLSEPGAEKTLQRDFDRQFGNAHGEIRSAARSLGLFGVKYLENDRSLSADERHHAVQLVAAFSAWGEQARLGDPKRARAAIARLGLAARRTHLTSEAAFRDAGMDESLRRMGPMWAALKDALRGYDLDLDDSLGKLQATLVERDGDRARVRMRYPLAGKTIDTVVAVERIDGHWYLSDFVRHARAATAPRAPALAPTAGPGTTPAVPAAPPPPVAAPPPA
jgi:hypothetical protein